MGKRASLGPLEDDEDSEIPQLGQGQSGSFSLVESQRNHKCTQRYRVQYHVQLLVAWYAAVTAERSLSSEKDLEIVCRMMC